jgi:hypothetical protein
MLEVNISAGKLLFIFSCLMDSPEFFVQALSSGFVDQCSKGINCNNRSIREPNS